METIRGICTLDQSTWRTATLGMFDGVHLGHQKVIAETVSWAKEGQGESLVLTFDRHPESVTRGVSPPFITSLEQRLTRFETLGVDRCVVLEFDDKLASVLAQTFVREVLREHLQINGVVWGFDCNFGRGGKGDFDLLRSLSNELDFTVRRVEPVCISGEVISSTAIREAITSGDLERAERMLGSRVTIIGSVVRGDNRGASLGFPTANLDLHHGARPPSGVYETWVKFRGRTLHKSKSGTAPRALPHRMGRSGAESPFLLPDTERHLALTNIGARPTFNDATALDADGLPNVEVHIIDFGDGLYGEDVEVEFVKKIRDEKEFKSSRELIKQIESDLEYVLKRNPRYREHTPTVIEATNS